MDALVRVLATLLIAMVIGPAAVAAPLAAYVRLPAVGTATVSPNGEQLALIATDGEQRSVVVQDLVTKAFKKRVNFGAVPVEAIRWVGERYLLITTAVQFDPPHVSGGLQQWRRLHVFDVETGTLKPLMGDTPDRLNNILRTPAIRLVNGVPTVFVEGIQFVENVGRIALYRVDPATGRSRVVAPAVEGSVRWLVGADGTVVARQMQLERPERWTLEVRIADTWKVIEESKTPSGAATLLGLGTDGRSVIYSISGQDRAMVWKEARLDGGAAAAPTPIPGRHSPLVDPQSGVVLGHYGWDGDQFNTVYTDAVDQRIVAKIQASFPSIEASIGSWSNDRRKVVVSLDRPGRSPATAIFDAAANTMDWVSVDYPDLAETDFGAKTRVRFKASDGLDLSGYLTRPPGRAQARNLPVIVLPHDGPTRRDEPGYDWMAQAIASRGYAVLQINYRGSSGLGADLLKAGDGEIGRKMQSDLSDGVRALGAGGLVDPGRACIVGFGYGGYAALAGVTLEPPTYRCAVAVLGRFELEWPEPGPKAGSDGAKALSRALGLEGPLDPRIAALSPLRQASKANAPVLLIDRRGPSGNAATPSELMARALKSAGKAVDMINVPELDTSLTRASAGFATLNATVTFLEKHNPPN